MNIDEKMTRNPPSTDKHLIAALEQISKITGEAIKPHRLDCPCDLCKVHEIARAAVTPWTQPDLFSFDGTARFIEKLSENRNNRGSERRSR